MNVLDQFRLDDRVAVITGGGGVLGSAMAEALNAAGATVVLTGRTKATLERAAERMPGPSAAFTADVLDRESLESLSTKILDRFGRIDILVNAAGGNMPGATLQPGEDLFGLSENALSKVIDLNLMGTLLPTLALGPQLSAHGQGSVVNISSVASTRVLTRVVGYSAAKAGVDNATRWMAVELARRFGTGLRVNAIAPGFFLADQNRALLTKEDGSLTERGRTIVEHTPAGRFGEPDELGGAVVWLCSDAARFVTGTVVHVDGGFTAFSGV